jgi:hypothetical protein
MRRIAGFVVLGLVAAFALVWGGDYALARYRAIAHNAFGIVRVQPYFAALRPRALPAFRLRPLLASPEAARGEI